MPPIVSPVGLVNRVLEREEWARERLSTHAGRSVRMICGPIDTTLAIAPTGMLSPASNAADLTLTIPPLRVPTLLAHPDRWSEIVAADGDHELAATLADLAQTLPWFVEQAFASAFGPVIGNRAADAGRALLGFPEQAARSFGASVTSYARDETSFGVKLTEVSGLGNDIAAVAARVDALAQRLDQAAAGDERGAKDKKPL